mmetsp:Transcript_13242/g.31078  ORF Transcript_13242/g.31078 Transcript_13242/m.31078 type:complete len:196 (+) Transcript_13242:150-737(+)
MESVETSHAEVSSKKDDDVSTRSEETSASTVDGATEKSTGEADDGGPLDGQSSAAAERRNSEDRKRLEVKQSRIQGAGEGLFTRVPFKKGEVVCCYESATIIPTRDAIRLEDKSYLMRLGPQKYIDLRNEMGVVARYVNDCRVPARYNVVFEKRPEEGRALAVALRAIAPGEELYVDYGKWYWAGCGIKPARLED